MYSTDSRIRMKDFDRDRKAELARMSNLEARTRSLKSKVKNDRTRSRSLSGVSDKLSVSQSSKQLYNNSRGNISYARSRSRSPVKDNIDRSLVSFTVLDARSYSSQAMKMILASQNNNPINSIDYNASAPRLDSSYNSPDRLKKSNNAAEYSSPPRRNIISPPFHSEDNRNNRISYNALFHDHSRQTIGDKYFESESYIDSHSNRNARSTVSISNNNINSAQLIYNSHFSGLQSIGQSGMTILEELIDYALRVCENGRIAGQTHHSRSAVLLSCEGKVYGGCDVYIQGNEIGGVSAERASILAAVADGATGYDCLVVCSDTMTSFPAPDGLTREFIRSFGIFPVILVNSNLEIKHTSSQELFPLNAELAENIPSLARSTSRLLVPNHMSTNEMAFNPVSFSKTIEPAVEEENPDVSTWVWFDIAKWLNVAGLSDLAESFQINKIDGHILLQIDENFARDTLLIQHPLRRKRLIRQIAILKKKQMSVIKEKTFDELDEYVMLLETQRIKLVAKLKVIFDRFDDLKEGRITGNQVEQLLLYMNRPIDSYHVNSWLNKLKNSNVKIDFIEFVSQYSSLFVGEDPDVPIGEGNKSTTVTHDKNLERSPMSKNAKTGEKWYEGANEFDDNNQEDDTLISIRHHEAKSKNILDIKVLAELKSIFDRFAVDGLMTAAETCQAINEAGLITPRREIAQYLRSRKHLGVKRSVSFFEFIRAYAAIRGPVEQLKSRKSKSNISDEESDSNDDVHQKALAVGSIVKAKYRGVGNFYRGKISKINRDGTYDVTYDDGELDSYLDANTVKPVKLTEYSDDRSVHYKIGAKVECNYRNKEKWIIGRIIRSRQDGTYDLEYLNGLSELKVPASSIRHPQKSDIYEVGDKIEAKFKGRSRWLPGSIKKIRKDGTYDIYYKNGDVEYGVDEHLIRISTNESSRGLGDEFEVGQKVEANYNGDGRWIAGRITRNRGNGTYDIEYENEDFETKVPSDLIQTLKSNRFKDDKRGREVTTVFDNGDKVEGNYRGRGKWYPGVIRNDRGNGYYDIDYDDGECEIKVKSDLIRLLEKNNKRKQMDESNIRVGDAIEGNYRGKGKWYPGKIKRSNSDETFDIEYDDGEFEKNVQENMIRKHETKSDKMYSEHQRIREGAKVEGNYRGKGKWYKGRIKRDRGDGTYDIEYDDGEAEARVGEELIRLIGGSDLARSPPRKARLEEGAKVEGNYRGKGKWYKGRIKRDR
eukprot:gene8402-11360_t